MKRLEMGVDSTRLQPPPLRICQVCGNACASQICPKCGASIIFLEWLDQRGRDRITVVLLWCSLFLVWFDWQALIAVVPTFADVFANFGAKLPAPTALLIQVSHSMQWLRGIPTLLWLVPLYFLIVFPFQRVKFYGLRTAAGLTFFQPCLPYLSSWRCFRQCLRST